MESSEALENKLAAGKSAIQTKKVNPSTEANRKWLLRHNMKDAEYETQQHYLFCNHLRQVR